IKDGVITGGMIPKVQSCIELLNNGIERVHIIDGRIPHSILLELFTHKGIGTLIKK
ncbi:MAG TPA: acetylglutamate kinase, partial [bacterium]|nr:acetylglutamate kinase [bacterium]